MARGPEGKLEDRDRTLAKAAGWFVEKIMRAARKGFPDRFYARAREEDVCKVCGRGRVMLIEWKTPDGRLDENQKIRISELRAAGVEVHVVNSIEEAQRIREADI